MEAKVKVREAADIGRVVRDERKRQKLTQVELAGLCRVGERFIVELEHGKASAKLGLALRVMSQLGIPLRAGDENARAGDDREDG
jgi:HTH-type transcriptional regulator/antitoxin HipB